MDKLELLKQVGEGGEIVTEEELKELLNNEKDLVAYDGFEPSGRIHIAQAVLRAININKITQTGIKFKMLVADWHAWANNKMGGDLDKIQTTGKYMIEVWKAAGLDPKNVEFVWASDLVKDDNYWKLVMQIARSATLKRVIRCSQIMGRKEGEALQASQILYPCMQAADIFYLNARICQLGMDQRKVNMLARELGHDLGYWKPISISHHMLMGLQKPPETDNTVDKATEMKMSKSKPDTAIFMDDDEAEINRKMKKAYCPEGNVEDNPLMEYAKYMIFERFDKFIVERPEKFGGNIEFNNFGELAETFRNRELHPADLKKAVAKYVNQLVQPIRDHFKEGEAKELLEKVKGYKVTR